MFGCIRHVRFPCDIYIIRHLDTQKTVRATFGAHTDEAAAATVCVCLLCHSAERHFDNRIVDIHFLSPGQMAAPKIDIDRKKRLLRRSRASFALHETVKPPRQSCLGRRFVWCVETVVELKTTSAAPNPRVQYYCVYARFRVAAN